MLCLLLGGVWSPADPGPESVKSDLLLGNTRPSATGTENKRTRICQGYHSNTKRLSWILIFYTTAPISYPPIVSAFPNGERGEGERGGGLTIFSFSP